MPKQPLTIHILTSCLGYGVYYPAVMVSHALRNAGFNTAMQILEHYYTPEKKETFKRTRNAFRENFALSQLASRWPTNYGEGVDGLAIGSLKQEWKDSGSPYFLIFSATWLPILEAYLLESPEPPVIDACRIDAGLSPVWKQAGNSPLPFHNWHLFDLPGRKVNYTIRNQGFAPARFADREQAVVMHGGGWSLGDYQAKADALAAHPFKRNIIVHSSDGLRFEQDVRYYMNDPHWDLLDLPPGSPAFPAFSGKLSATGVPSFKQQSHMPGIYEVINNSRAIIAKPGGMTLLDSLITCTPLVYLEAMGDNETGNASLWESLGMAISFNSWQQSGFDERELQRLQQNITACNKELPDFTECYRQKIMNPKK